MVKESFWVYSIPCCYDLQRINALREYANMEGSYQLAHAHSLLILHMLEYKSSLGERQWAKQGYNVCEHQKNVLV